MKKLLAFAGSTSSTSINQQLVNYTVSLIEEIEVDVIEMRNYTSILFSVDEEKNGFPENMKALSEQFKEYDGFIISLAEHNGSYAAAYKNTIDWLSRIDRKVFNDKPVLLMSASPGGRGGASVSEDAQSYYPRLGAHIIEVFSLPNFYNNFKEGKLTDEALSEQLKNSLTNYLQEI